MGNLKKRDRLTADLWTVEDRGYKTPCWIWNAAPRRGGYCRVKFQGRVQLPHRVMHEQEIGPIPTGYDVDHLCSQRACVNPAHLEAVTRAENIRRSRTARLTATDVAMIRASTLSDYKIAKILGVSRAAVNDARRGTTWA